MKRSRRRELFECPNCGADVPVGAAACRECGSDARTGWQSSEEIEYQSLELPENDDEDDDEAARERGTRRPSLRLLSRRVVWITAAVLVLALVVALLRLVTWNPIH